MTHAAPRLRLLAGLLVCALASSPSARACETPVYRYSLYNWENSPYRAYYLYRGTPAEADAEANARLAALAAGSGPKTCNLVFQSVDLGSEADLERLPDFLQEQWSELPADATPLHLVLTPHLDLLYHGKLSVEDANALADSPARQEVCKQLAAGRVGVFVLLRGSDASETEPAEEEIQRFVAQPIDTGRLRLDEEAVELLGSEPRVGFVAIDRDDPAERWFVRMLQHLDRGELQPGDEELPFVYAVYGRGRAHWPSYIGAGIQQSGLADLLEFVSGACTCEIKDQNPGIDLLTTWDWPTSVQTLAHRIGEEPGNQTLLMEQTLFGVAEPTPAKPIASSSPPTSEQPADAAAAESTPTAQQGAAPGESPEADAEPAALAEPDATATSGVDGLTLWLGAGLLGATVLVLGLGFLLRKPVA